MNKRIIIIVLYVLSTLLVNAQDKPISEIIPGKGIGKIEIGKSTENDVINLYGKNYKRLSKGTNLNEIMYTTAGISFLYGTDDKIKTISIIEFTSSFKGEIEKGIFIGKSTLGEVINALGQGQWYHDVDLPRTIVEYPGIVFEIKRDKLPLDNMIDRTQFLKEKIVTVRIIHKR